MSTFTSAKLQGMIGKATALNATQKAMLHAACRWIDWNTLEFWPSVESWAQLASLSGETIRKHCRALEALGVIVVESRSRGGRSQSNRYRLIPSALIPQELTLFGPVGCAVKHPTSDRETPNLASRNPQLGAAKPPTTLPLPIQRTIKPPQPPRTRGNIPDLESAPAGGGRGGDSQSLQREATPAATPACRVESEEPSPTREANREPRRASEAINAPGANPLADAIEALGPPPRVAAELAALPHVTAARVQFVAEQAAKQQPHRPDRWAAMMLGLPDDELSGYRPWLRKHQARQAAIDGVRRQAIHNAIAFAHHHKDGDAVYGRFCRAVLDAIRVPWPTIGDAKRDAQLPRELLNPNASPLAVLRSLALSCGSDIEIPTDTLRMPEARGDVAQVRQVL